MRNSKIVLILFIAVSLFACGYALVGKKASLPPNIRSVFIEPMENKTSQSGISETLTSAMVREFVSRGKFQIAAGKDKADAVLSTEIDGFSRSPVALQEGKATFYQITITAKVELKERQKDKVLFRNDHYVFRDEYEVPEEAQNFFDQELESVQQISEDFAASLISTILEGF
jgi:PBP1b-binding outer membrane lipoprotein LpoB